MANASFMRVVTAPRWTDLSTYIKVGCAQLGLSLAIDVKKGWIRETIIFSVEGPEAQVLAFARQMTTDMKEYNA